MNKLQAFREYFTNGVHSSDEVCDFVADNWQEFTVWRLDNKIPIADKVAA